MNTAVRYYELLLRGNDLSSVNPPPLANHKRRKVYFLSESL
jgi:hypothetical protein